MMSGKKEAVLVGIGILAGLALSGPAAQAADYLQAKLSNQTIYVDGQKVEMEAYFIHNNNFVKLRDIGEAVGFNVYWDGATQTVQVESDKPYTGEASASQRPAELTEESVRTAIQALRDIYPTGTLYGAPYIPIDPLNRPYSNCDACAGWAMKCSDAAFGNLPYRRIINPRWEAIRVGDLVEYDNAYGGHVVVVLEKTDDYIKVTESDTSNETLWGGQYFRWWLEQQSDYALRTRYPE